MDKATQIECNKQHLAPWDPRTPEDFYTEPYWKEKIEVFRAEYKEEKSLRLNIWLKESSVRADT